MTKTNGILITRTDRIGDLVLSLPAIRTIKKKFPDEPIHLMVSSYAYPIVEHYPGIDSIIKYDRGEDGSSDVDRTKQLIQKVSELNCRVALLLVYDSNVLSIIKKAGIKERYGPLTKIRGFFSYTKWLSQHRSRVEQHELEYNLDLLKLIGVQESEFDYSLELPVPKTSVERAFEKLKEIGFKEPEGGYIIIHPSMGGSALNWTYAFYTELASRLSQDTGLPIVVTGTSNDSHITASITQHIAGTSFNAAGIFSLHELIGVISKTRLFIAPSTGPLHISAAIGIPTVGIFSPVKVQTAKRWGPYSKDSVTVTPQVDCPGKLECLGEKCKHNSCMDLVSVDEVFEKAKKIYYGCVKQMDLSF